MGDISSSIPMPMFPENSRIPAGDWRTRDLLLMHSFWNVIILLAVYLLIVYYIGPKWMERYQDPFDTYSYLVWHNLFLVLTNAVFGLSLLACVIYTRQNLLCEPVRNEETVDDLIAYLMYGLLLLKIFELGDALALICKKLEPPFILIFHHSTIVAVVWMGVKYGPGGSATFPTLLNSLVHVLIYMHFKYGRKFFSHNQSRKIFIMIYFVQFAVVTFLSSSVLYLKCGYPEWIAAICVTYNVVLMLVYFKSMWSLWCSPEALPEVASSSSEDEDEETEPVEQVRKTTSASTNNNKTDSNNNSSNTSNTSSKKDD